MNRIQEKFQQLEAQGRKAFIPFITAGDPSLNATERFIITMADAGADIIEIGIPFSDPAADGPVISRANVRAMQAGVNVHSTFEMLSRVRERTNIPLAFLIYANIIFSYGIERFFVRCAEIGIDGVIIGDVPIEEEGEFAPFAKANGVEIIRMIAPTSHSRTERICKDAGGFLYCVSSMGVTGVRSSVESNLTSMFEQIDRHCKVPTAIGFGVGTPEQAKAAAKFANGVIVGSAIVKLIEQYAEQADRRLFDFVSSMRFALDN